MLEPALTRTDHSNGGAIAHCVIVSCMMHCANSNYWEMWPDKNGGRQPLLFTLRWKFDSISGEER